MDKDKIFSFYEKMYFESLNEMNVVLSRFPILIAGVALIINAYIFLFNFDYFLWLPKPLVLIAVLAIAVSIGSLLFCMFKTFKSKVYAIMPDLGELAQFEKDMVQWGKDMAVWNKENPDIAQEIPDIGQEVLANIESLFIKCVATNSESSMERNRWFHKSMFWIWINLCLCITIPILTIVITM